MLPYRKGCGSRMWRYSTPATNRTVSKQSTWKKAPNLLISFRSSLKPKNIKPTSQTPPKPWFCLFLSPPLLVFQLPVNHQLLISNLSHHDSATGAQQPFSRPCQDIFTGKLGNSLPGGLTRAARKSCFLTMTWTTSKRGIELTRGRKQEILWHSGVRQCGFSKLGVSKNEQI